jgi:thymidylate kinase
MKILIIEGPDNCGKDTLIKNVAAHYNIVKTIHCDKPTETDPDSALMNQSVQFVSLANLVINDYINKSEDIAIFNRYHYGEYIYGQIYRNENVTNILSTIRYIDSILNNGISEKDICYIQLMSDNEDFLFKNDDGLSLSENNKNLIKKECKLFKEIYEKSLIKNKHLVYVNNNSSFRSQQELTNEVLNYINNEQI